MEDHPYEANYEQWSAVKLGSESDWPRNITEIDCPNCDGPAPVMQTSYGARATCRPCCIRWTTLFSEKGWWTDEQFSPITDNATRGRDDHDAETARAGRAKRSEAEAAARAGSGDDG